MEFKGCGGGRLIHREARRAAECERGSEFIPGQIKNTDCETHGGIKSSHSLSVIFVVVEKSRLSAHSNYKNNILPGVCHLAKQVFQIVVD